MCHIWVTAGGMFVILLQIWGLINDLQHYSPDVERAGTEYSYSSFNLLLIFCTSSYCLHAAVEISQQKCPLVHQTCYRYHRRYNLPDVGHQSAGCTLPPHIHAEVSGVSKTSNLKVSRVIYQKKATLKVQSLLFMVQDTNMFSFSCALICTTAFIQVTCTSLTAWASDSLSLEGCCCHSNTSWQVDHQLLEVTSQTAIWWKHISASLQGAFVRCSYEQTQWALASQSSFTYYHWHLQICANIKGDFWGLFSVVEVTCIFTLEARMQK